MSPRRGLPIAIVVAALLNGGAALADEPAGAAAQGEIPTEQNTVPPTPSATSISAAASSQAAASSAQQAVAAPAARTGGPVSGNTSGMISGLIFLLLLVLGAAWLIRRSGGMPALRGGSSMKIVAALSLGPRERVVLIELGGQQWLLGVSGGSVSMLHHFEQPIATGSGDDFAGKLRQLWPQGLGSQGPGSQEPRK